jgi:hypothetical protein
MANIAVAEIGTEWYAGITGMTDFAVRAGFGFIIDQQQKP